MSNDMSDIMNKLNSMLKNNELPDDIKNIVNNFKKNGIDAKTVLRYL